MEIRYKRSDLLSESSIIQISHSQTLSLVFCVQFKRKYSLKWSQGNSIVIHIWKSIFIRLL